MDGIGNIPGGFRGARSLPGEDERFGGAYGGEYTDPDHAAAWQQAYGAKEFQSPITELRNYKVQYVAECQKLNRKPDFAIVWGLNKLSSFDIRFSAAKTDAEFDAILEEFAILYSENGSLIDKASNYISAKREAEAEYLRTIREATDAHAAGDKERAAALEAKLSTTDELDTRAVRQLISADVALYN